MKIQKAAAGDMEKVKYLWQECFDDKKEFVDFFFSTRYNNENTLCVYEDGKLLSCLHLLPYKISLRGKAYKASYIVGVSTLPEYRDRGLAKTLLHYSLEYMDKADIPISILLPFKYSFYDRYGWAICYDHLRYSYESGIGMPEIKADFSQNRQFKVIDKKTDIEPLNKIYNGYIESYNGYIIRSKDDWLRIIADYEFDNGSGCLYIKNGKPSGYFMYIKENNQLQIKELAYTSPEAKRNMMLYIYSIMQDYKQTFLHAPINDLSFLSMPDPRGCINKEAFVMGRINNVAKALSGVSVNDKCSIYIKVIDHFNKSNNMTFLLTVEDGMLNVYETKHEHDVILSINALSQLLWGYAEPMQAYKQGLLSVNSEEALDCLIKLFPKQDTYIIEEY